MKKIILCLVVNLTSALSFASVEVYVEGKRIKDITKVETGPYDGIVIEGSDYIGNIHIGGQKLAQIGHTSASLQKLILDYIESNKIHIYIHEVPIFALQVTASIQ